TRFTESLGDERIAKWLCADECEGTGRRHHSIAGVDVVFDKNRDAVEWATWTSLFTFAIECRCNLLGVGIEFDDRCERGAFLIDIRYAIGIFLDQLPRSIFA